MSRVWVALAAAMLLSGCASVGTKFDPAVADSIAPGTTRTEVIAKLGQPNSETTMGNGQKMLMWLFSEANGLTGKSHAQMVSFLFDADGHVIRQISKSQTNMKVN